MHIYAVGRGFGPLEAFFFFFCKKCFSLQNRAFKQGNPVQHEAYEIPGFWGPNSLTYGTKFPDLIFPWNTLPSTFASIPRNPYFCRVFFKFLGLHEDSPKMARNACEKECYYLVSEPRGWFLCWDQIPSCAKFAVLPVGMLKPVTSPETPIFIAFSEFSGIGIFWRARPPPLYFLPHFPVSPFMDPKKCPKK